MERETEKDYLLVLERIMRNARAIKPDEEWLALIRREGGGYLG